MSLWKIKLPRGNKVNLPSLSLGEPAYITDEGELYIGGLNGENINITNNTQLNANTKNIATNTSDINKLKTDTGWKDISLDLGTIYVQPQYRKKDNRVCFRGRITGITLAETTILTLPAGYRPSQNIYEIISINNGRYATIVITSAGAIIISSISDNVYNPSDIYRLDNITFLAD